MAWPECLYGVTISEYVQLVLSENRCLKNEIRELTKLIQEKYEDQYEVILLCRAICALINQLN